MNAFKDAARFGFLALALVIFATLFISPAPETEAAIIKRTRLTIDTVGAEGSAGGSDSTDEVIQGQVLRIDIDYGSITTTTDLTIIDSTDLVDTNLVSKSNTATDGQVFPTISLTDNTGAAVTYDGTRPIKDYIPVAGKLTATLTQTTAATPAVTIDVYWREDK